MGWNPNAAVDHLEKNARTVSTGHCARFTVNAIEAGGLHILRTMSAKNLGPSLIGAGFQPISNQGPFQAGDVVIIQNFAGNEHGHAEMYTGTQWISDFRQRELYPGPGYRSAKPPYQAYRHP